ncbi:unnamed protein product, partial [Discosporangium mesarthrocarpum]
MNDVRLAVRPGIYVVVRTLYSTQVVALYCLKFLGMHILCMHILVCIFFNLHKIPPLPFLLYTVTNSAKDFVTSFNHIQPFANQSTEKKHRTTRIAQPPPQPNAWN